MRKLTPEDELITLRSTTEHSHKEIKFISKGWLEDDLEQIKHFLLSTGFLPELVERIQLLDEQDMEILEKEK